MKNLLLTMLCLAIPTNTGPGEPQDPTTRPIKVRLDTDSTAESTTTPPNEAEQWATWSSVDGDGDKRAGKMVMANLAAPVRVARAGIPFAHTNNSQLFDCRFQCRVFTKQSRILAYVLLSGVDREHKPLTRMLRIEYEAKFSFDPDVEWTLRGCDIIEQWHATAEEAKAIIFSRK